MKTPVELRGIPELLILENTPLGGSGYIRYGSLKNASVIWTRDHDGYDHVSICPNKRTPSWEEMCAIKDIFFYDEEECYQVFPKKSEYVNIMENCLHIWRDTKKE